MSVAAVLPAPAIHERVLSHLIDVLDRTAMHTTPFTHVWLPTVFPPDLYEVLLDRLPGTDLYYPDRRPTRCTLPLSEANLARLSHDDREFWSGVAGALQSVELKRRIFGLFADDLCRRFTIDRAALDRLTAYPRPSLIRDLTGYSIAPHPDTQAKIVTVQFYLARDGSQRELGTALYRRRLFNPRNLLSLKNMFEKVKQFDFAPNSGYAFPVGRRTWHGRDAVPDTAGERNSILLFYYLDSSREW